MTIKTENLIELKPTDDMEYLLDLSDAYKYDVLSREKHKELLKFYGKHFWNIYDNGVKMGVIFTQYIPALHWTVDGYTDSNYDGAIKRRVTVAIDAMKMVTQFLLDNVTDVIRTTHSKKNKAADKICKRAGYFFLMELESEIGTHNIFEYRRQSNGN